MNNTDEQEHIKLWNNSTEVSKFPWDALSMSVQILPTRCPIGEEKKISLSTDPRNQQYPPDSSVVLSSPNTS